MTSAPSAPHQRDGHTGPGSADDPGTPSGRPGPDVVELELPADPAYLGVVRTACAGLGARLDLTLDEIEDLRIAVDEACTLVLPSSAGVDAGDGFDLHGSDAGAPEGGGDQVANGSGPARTLPARLHATFSVSASTLAVRVQGPNPQLPVDTSYAWAVLEALAGDVSSGVEPAGSWISLTHTRARAA